MNTILAILLLFHLSALGDDIFDVAEKYNSKKKDVVNLEARKRAILSDVYDLEKKTRKIVEEKSSLGDKKFQMEVSLQKTSKEIIEIENDLKKMTPQLQKRLSYVHKIQDLPWMYAFMSSYSIAELDRMIKTFENINNQEAAVTISYFNKLSELKKKKEELKKIAIEMVSLKKVIVAKEKKIKSQHIIKKKMLKNLKANIASSLSELSKIKNKGKKLASNPEYKNLTLLFGTAFFDKKGELPHPVKATVVHHYGLNKKLIKDNVELFHKGFFYKARKSEPVQAIADGRVKFAGAVHGVGNVIVIDHGGRYYSVYSNLWKIEVKENAVIEAKQIIAKVGAQSLQFKEGLYFEIRHFSEPEDPEKWLKQRNNQLAGL